MPIRPSPPRSEALPSALPRQPGRRTRDRRPVAVPHGRPPYLRVPTRPFPRTTLDETRSSPTVHQTSSRRTARSPRSRNERPSADRWTRPSLDPWTATPPAETRRGGRRPRASPTRPPRPPPTPTPRAADLPATETVQRPQSWSAQIARSGAHLSAPIGSYVRVRTRFGGRPKPTPEV